MIIDTEFSREGRGKEMVDKKMMHRKTIEDWLDMEVID